MERIYRILANILGESKQGGYIPNCTQYQFNCPSCAEEKGEIDGKYNLEISFSLWKYHCWSCNISGGIGRLIKRYGGWKIYTEYMSVLSDIRESNMYVIPKTDDGNTDDKGNVLTLPKTFRPITPQNCPKKLNEFLLRRKIGYDIIEKFGLGYTGWDEEPILKNRLVIPSYDKLGNLNFWVGRDYTGFNKKTKYYNCNVDKKKVVFLENKINYNADIVLVEGAIDALYGNNIIALLGKTLSQDSFLYQRLKEKANANITICLDSDTKEDETERIRALLDTGRLENRIRYIRLGTDELPYKDFGEIYESEGRKGIISALCQAKRFNNEKLFFYGY